MIRVSHITKTFHNTPAVDDLSFEISRGHVVGLLGPNGAGKTTTMRMLTGFLEPDTGTISINGKNIREHVQEIKHMIGYLPENNPLYDEMTVEEYLLYAARLKGVPRKSQKEEIRKAAESAGLAEVFFRPISELSKGYRQRTGLAQALLRQPDILILDEPTEGLDPNQRRDMRDLIRSLGKNHTVILSTHVMQEVDAVCDHVIILKEGKKATEGTKEEIMRHTARKRVLTVTGKRISTENLRSIEGVEEILSEHERNGSATFRLAVSSEDAGERIFSAAVKHGWILSELALQTESLEDIFHELTES